MFSFLYLDFNQVVMPQQRTSLSFKRDLPIVILYSFLFGYLVNRFTSRLTPIDYQRNISTLAANFFNRPQSSSNAILSTRTLIIYVYGETHASAEENLVFFIRAAVRSSHDADYYFILQQIKNKVPDEKKLPPLPSNAQYIQHEDKCFDLGSIGWLLSTGRIDRTKYKYFVFLNSSVRGPFIVSYHNDPVWFRIFTRRLTEYVRLVGCTFNCDPSPHVQSYLWAMNGNTLDFLLNSTKVFTCHESLHYAINDGEIAASRAIFQAGFSLDSLMTKYRDLDLRANFMIKCPYRTHPTPDRGVDGITLDPYEVVFVKIKAESHLFRHNLKRVHAYGNWTGASTQ